MTFGEYRAELRKLGVSPLAIPTEDIWPDDQEMSDEEEVLARQNLEAQALVGK